MGGTAQIMSSGSGGKLGRAGSRGRGRGNFVHSGPELSRMEAR